MATLTSEVKRLADVKAPAGFAERVLAQAGAADSYAVFETVLGPVYVSWNRLGVSAAMRSKSAAEFEPTLEKMLAAAKSFDASKIRADQVARSGGPPPGTE